MAQVRIKNLTQHRIYVPVPVGIMMRPAQEILLSEVSDDLLAQSRKISLLVERGIIQIGIQPHDPDIDDTLETRFLKTGGGTGDVVGPTGATDEAIARYDLTTGKLLQDSLVTIDDTGNISLPASATVDGRDISADAAHFTNTSNPHATDIGNLGTGTLAELNSAITDATLDDSSAARTPTSHAASHQNGGADEVATATPAASAIPKADGSGTLNSWVSATSETVAGKIELATQAEVNAGTDTVRAVTPATLAGTTVTPEAHAASHNAGGADALAIDAVAGTGSLRTLGTTSTSACAGNDSRLSDARTPTAHASTHDAGGGDALAIDAVAGTGSLRTLGTSATAACAGNDSRLSDARTPTSHAASHQSGGGDAIKLDDLASPDDTTDLDASTGAHGLLPKLGGGTTDFLRADGSWAAPGTGQTLYDAIVAPSGGDYTSVYAAFNAGATTVYVRTGTYVETNSITLPDGAQLVGEDGTVIDFNGGALRVQCDGSGGTKEITGTIGVTQDSDAVVGSGTTFTNLSPGDFILIASSFFEIQSITDNTNLTLVYDWRGPSVAGLPMYGQSMNQNIGLSNILILNSSIQGLYLRALRGFSILNVVVTACQGNNVEVRDSYGGNIEQLITKHSSANGVLMDSVYETVLDGYCHCDNNVANGILLTGDCDDVKICNSSFTSNGNDGLNINGTSHNCSIHGCVSAQNGARGLNTGSGTSTTSMIGCVVEHNTGYGIDWDGSRNSIAACTVISNVGGGLQGGDVACIVGNHIDQNDGIGINLADGDDLNTIVGNNITNNSGDGIRVDGENCMFTSNLCTLNGGAGVNVLSGAVNNRFSNNHVAGNSGTNFADAGTGTLVLDGTVVGPSSSTDNAVARYDLTTGKLIQNSLVTIDDGGNIGLQAAATVDGRDISADAAHFTDTTNPHGTDLGNLGTGTLAELNTVVTDGTVPKVTAVAPVDVTRAAAVVGTSDEAARQDHKHDVTTAAPTVGIGAGNQEGSSTSVSRADHNHTIRETGGPTDLTVAGITNGYSVRRSGTTLTGVNPYDPYRTIVVATQQVGADATSIADAITAVNALSPAPSASAPATILVHPGVYSTAPFVLPDHVTLVGVGGAESVELQATTTTSALCTANGGSVIQDLLFTNANGVGGIGIDVGGTTDALHVKNVYVKNCTTGIRCSGAGKSLHVLSCEVWGATNGLLIDGAGDVRLDGLCIRTSTNGFRIGSGGGLANGNNLRVLSHAGETYHVWVEGAASTLTLTGSYFREDRTSYHASATVNVQHMTLIPGDEAMQVTAELHVGTEYRPRESAFGGGDSHTRGMAALRNTNLEVGTWSNITTGLADEDAVSVALFAGVGVGNCYYMGGDVQFPGLKPKVTLARAGGALVLEYWNGSAWTEIPHLSSDADAPYNQYAQNVFSRVNSEQIRFGTISGWATKSLNGITKYWVRFRVTTALTTIPTADRVKLHTNRTEVNADGVVEYFGAAEPVRQLVWHRRLMEEMEGFAQPDEDIDIASGLSIKALANRWQDGNKDGSTTFLQALPGLDTSRPLIYEVGWWGKTSAAGNVEVQLDVVTVNAGNVLDGTLPYTWQLSSIVTGPFTAFALNVTQLSFTVPDLTQTGSLVLALYRDASGGNLDDTYAGDAAHVYSRVLGTFWR